MKSPARFDRILVTGASGFIGGHLCQELAGRGYRLRAVYRRPAPPEHLVTLAGNGADVIQTDLGKEEDCAKACSGVDAVIHAAATPGDWGPHEMYLKDNYEMTVRLLGSAREAGVRAFVFMSSIGVHGTGEHLGTDENGPFYPPTIPYQATKKMAEEFVLSHNSPGFRTTAIRAGNVCGPRDTTTFYPIFSYMEKRLISYLKHGSCLTCPVYVGDLVDAVIAALETEESGGEAFIITSGEKVSWKELFEVMAHELGITTPLLNYPVIAGYIVAYFLQGVVGLANLLGIRAAPPLTVYRLEHYIRNYYFSIEKARRILGYQPKTGWREGLKITIKEYVKSKGADHEDRSNRRNGVHRQPSHRVSRGAGA